MLFNNWMPLLYLWISQHSEIFCKSDSHNSQQHCWHSSCGKWSISVGFVFQEVHSGCSKKETALHFLSPLKWCQLLQFNFVNLWVLSHWICIKSIFCVKFLKQLCIQRQILLFLLRTIIIKAHTYAHTHHPPTTCSAAAVSRTKVANHNEEAFQWSQFPFTQTQHDLLQVYRAPAFPPLQQHLQWGVKTHFQGRGRSYPAG